MVILQPDESLRPPRAIRELAHFLAIETDGDLRADCFDFKRVPLADNGH